MVTPVLNGSTLERRKTTDKTEGSLCESTVTSRGLSIYDRNADNEGQVNSPALIKPKKPVQHAAQSMHASP